jgi:cytosine/adenosine deaminase-related metal-dependent hydrolase
MAYRKFKADHLFNGDSMLPAGSVLITDESGWVQGILPVEEAGEGIENFHGILCPGFVNCHCHLELSFMKGLVEEGTGLVDFLLRVMGGRDGAASYKPQAASRQLEEERREWIQECIANAERYMMDQGIVAVGDICNTTDTLAQKKEGRIFYHNFIETAGFIEAGAASRFEQAVEVFRSFAGAYSLPIESNSIVPHAPYSVSPRLFRLIAGFPGNHLLTIHNQESEEENIFCRTGEGEFHRLYQALGLDISFFKGLGSRSLASYLPHFYRNQTVLMVHNVATIEEDVEEAASFKLQATSQIEEKGSPEKGSPELYFCLCANANLYISGRLPDLPLLARRPDRIVLGTDSLASNHQLSILEEMKTLQARFPWLPTSRLLQWATLNGARALQMDEVLGSFVTGKRPGVVLLEAASYGLRAASSEGPLLGMDARVRRLL